MDLFKEKKLGSYSGRAVLERQEEKVKEESLDINGGNRSTRAWE